MSGAREPSDGDLAGRAAAGDLAAFDRLMRRHQAPVYRMVRGLIGDADEALDVTQDSFFAAYRALARFDRGQPFRPWLARIAINKCRDWQRRRAVRGFFAFARPLAEAAGLADGEPSAADVAEGRDALAGVAWAIAALPAPLKEVLLLRTVEGLSQAETAEVLRISGKAVETRLYRARARLAELLAAGQPEKR